MAVKVLVVFINKNKLKPSSHSAPSLTYKVLWMILTI